MRPEITDPQIGQSGQSAGRRGKPDTAIWRRWYHRIASGGMRGLDATYTEPG